MVGTYGGCGTYSQNMVIHQKYGNTIILFCVLKRVFKIKINLKIHLRVMMINEFLFIKLYIIKSYCLNWKISLYSILTPFIPFLILNKKFKKWIIININVKYESLFDHLENKNIEHVLLFNNGVSWERTTKLFWQKGKDV